MASLSALTFMVFSIFAPQSEASIGVGVQRSPVRLAAKAIPGQSYSLPSVHIANAGSQAETIRVRVDRLSAGPGRPVPPSWIHISNSPMRLSAKQETKIPLQLVVPADAKAGRYLSDIVVIGSAPSVASREANFRAGAATKLQFTVAPARGRGPWASLPSWAQRAIAIFLVVIAALVAGRLSGLRVVRVPRKRKDRIGVNNLGGPGA